MRANPQRSVLSQGNFDDYVLDCAFLCYCEEFGNVFWNKAGGSGLISIQYAGGPEDLTWFGMALTGRDNLIS